MAREMSPRPWPRKGARGLGVGLGGGAGGLACICFTCFEVFFDCGACVWYALLASLRALAFVSLVLWLPRFWHLGLEAGKTVCCKKKDVGFGFGV